MIYTDVSSVYKSRPANLDAEAPKLHAISFAEGIALG